MLATPYSEYFGQVSPDSRWLLFTSDQSGRDEIYVTSYPTPGVMNQVSRDGGHKAAWNGTSEIVYKVGTEMYAVDVALTPDFRAGQPKLLFAGAFPNIPGFDFAVAPGGQEFLMLENKEFMQPGDDAHRHHRFLRRPQAPRSGARTLGWESITRSSSEFFEAPGRTGQPRKPSPATAATQPASEKSSRSHPHGWRRASIASPGGAAW